MNLYFVAAAILALIVGLIHSVLGEVLIFRRMRKTGVIPTDGGSVLQERHVRIVWASWHALTVFGWFVAATLFWLSAASSRETTHGFLETSIMVAMSVSSALVLLGTKGKHPGWVGLLAVAILVWLGRAAGPGGA